jgi:hypothetical protein
MGRFVRRVFGLALLLALLVVGGGLALKTWSDRTFYAGYDAADPLNPALRGETAEIGRRTVEVAIDGARGNRVPVVLTVPTDAEPPFPCVLFLHGINQDKAFTQRLAPAFAEAGFALAGFDQYTRGERALPEGAGAFRRAMAFRHRAALTVLDARRVLDYLESRDDIAGNRLYLVGASYGAITGATAAAFDSRVRAVALAYGGGDLPILLDSRAAREALGKRHGLAGAFAWWWLAPADPVHHVHRIAPRPLLLLNGRNDPLIPARAAQAMYRHAAEPKEQVWFEGGHLEPGTARVREVVEHTIGWLRERDAAASARPWRRSVYQAD